MSSERSLKNHAQETENLISLMVSSYFSLALVTSASLPEGITELHWQVSLRLMVRGWAAAGEVHARLWVGVGLEAPDR